MFKKFIAGAIAAAAIFATSVPSADAYLHLANAQSRGCQIAGSPYFESWSKQYIGPGPAPYVEAYGNWYQRINDNALLVDCVMIGNWQGYPYSTPPWWADTHSQGEVRIYVVGNDGSEGLAFVNGYPDWRYLGWKVADNQYGAFGCPNWGGYCLRGNWSTGF